MRIYSLEVEKHVLGGIINHTSVFSEIERFVEEKDFVNDVHQTVFSVIKNIVNNNEILDKVLLSEKVKNLGVSFKDEINIFEYIDSISFTQITHKATVDACKELLKLRIRREIAQTGRDIITHVEKNGADNLDELVSACDSIYNQKISKYTFDDEPENLFSGMEDLVEERGNEPTEDEGLLTPYPEFNRLYGGLRPGNVYAIVSRPGQGKTTWINNVVLRTAQRNDVKVLLLDTEMSTQDIQFRMASAITNVPMWYLETGNWRKSEELTSRVRSKLKDVRNNECYHSFVGNKNIDQICALVRRWYLSEVGRGNRCIIAYDYVKLTGERVGQNWAEYQAIGDKIDRLKKVAEEIGAPLITAMQMNRSGERGAQGSIVDDSSAISLSDRLQWFASFVAIFRRKTLEEIADDGEDFGSHKLIPLKTRFQGKDAQGHHDLIRRTDNDGSVKYINNFLNFSVENFRIEERGSLRHIIESQSERFELDDRTQGDGEINI